jgi:hypothetical protein
MSEQGSDAPNESAPGHHPVPDDSHGHAAEHGDPPHDDELDVEAPNESAPGHHPDS